MPEMWGKRNNLKGQSVLFSSASDEHITPPDLYFKLDQVFKFDFDPCTTEHNPLNVKHFRTLAHEQIDKQKVTDLVVNYNTFINPPYSEVETWVNCAIKWSEKFPLNCYVMLVASRTDRPYYKAIHGNFNALCFIQGRLKFWEHEPLEWHFEDQKNGQKKKIVTKRGPSIVLQKYQAPFPSLIAVFCGVPLNQGQKRVLNELGQTFFKYSN